MAATSQDQITPQDQAKLTAAKAALEFVKDGMRLGLGTGTTAAIFVELLAERVANGLTVIGVPTSERTRAQAESLSILLATLEEEPALDLTIDGADEFDSQLRLIKGGGGALLREKIVAAASASMVVIADTTKRVETLGAFPLPVEIVPFGVRATTQAIAKALKSAGCDGEIIQRKTSQGLDFVTDGDHFIADCHIRQIPDPEHLAASLNAIPGVVEHGLFIDLASTIVVAGTDGVEILGIQAE